MTIIRVTTPQGRLNTDQKRALATTLTDAVLVPEVGQPMPPARVGFQVHFNELNTDSMAINGELLSDEQADVVTIDIAVMAAAWPAEVRTEVIRRVLAALAEACDMSAPGPLWWVNFRIIDEGSWGSRGDVLSILDLLDTGVFTDERKEAIKAALNI